MEDSLIIALLNKRDEAAVSALSEKYGGLIMSIASNLLADRRDAEECLSEVLFKVWSSVPPADPKNLTAYIAKAARNEAISRCRERNAKRNPSALVPLSELADCLSDNKSLDESVIAGELGSAVESFLKKLPADERRVFLRRYWFFDPVNAIAERYGLSERRVTTIIQRTRRALRRYLIKEEFINE